MKTVKCIGYEGRRCGKIVKRTSPNQKRCSSCAIQSEIARGKSYSTAYRRVNFVRCAAYDKAYRKAHPERHLMHNRAWRAANPGKARESSWHSQGIITKDGAPLTYARFSKDAKKGCGFKGLGACADRLEADHDHKTGLYRGPLCRAHNSALGKLGDFPESLRRAAKILENKA